MASADNDCFTMSPSCVQKTKVKLTPTLLVCNDATNVHPPVISFHKTVVRTKRLKDEMPEPHRI